ncbi:MAG: SRPBCC family protein [Sumerlaeia bacterium]
MSVASQELNTGMPRETGRPRAERPDLPEESRARSPRARQNVSESERAASAAIGGALALYGIRRLSWGWLAVAAAGGVLLKRGLTGHCDLYERQGINTAGATDALEDKVRAMMRETIRVRKTLTIDRPAYELYHFWRNLENLPQFMKHLKDVRTLDAWRSHWVARGPAGISVEWDAEIVDDRENELISWESVEGSHVENEGSVRFHELGDGRTEVTVRMRYEPPAGKIGAGVAKLFGEEPRQQMEDALREFKTLMETGEHAVTEVP